MRRAKISPSNHTLTTPSQKAPPPASSTTSEDTAASVVPIFAFMLFMARASLYRIGSFLNLFCRA